MTAAFGTSLYWHRSDPATGALARVVADAQAVLTLSVLLDDDEPDSPWAMLRTEHRSGPPGMLALPPVRDTAASVRALHRWVPERLVVAGNVTAAALLGVFDDADSEDGQTHGLVVAADALGRCAAVSAPVFAGRDCTCTGEWESFLPPAARVLVPDALLETLAWTRAHLSDS